MRNKEELTTPMVRALHRMRTRELRRTSEGWMAHDGYFIANPTVISLVKRGLARRSQSRRQCVLTDAGRCLELRELVDIPVLQPTIGQSAPVGSPAAQLWKRRARDPRH